MEKLTFEQFQHKYRHLISDDIGCLYWSDNRGAYNAYLKVSDDEFMDKLNEHIDFSEFCKKFYDVLRQEWNACGALMQDEFEKMKKLGGDDKYIETLRKRIRGFDKYYGYQFGIPKQNTSEEESDYDEESDDED